MRLGAGASMHGVEEEQVLLGVEQHGVNEDAEQRRVSQRAEPAAIPPELTAVSTFGLYEALGRGA